MAANGASRRIKIDLKPMSVPVSGDLVLLVGDDLELSPMFADAFHDLQPVIERAARVEAFKGKAKSAMVLLAPPATEVDRLILVGLGPTAERGTLDWVALGGAIMGKLTPGRSVCLATDINGEPATPEQIADLVLGLRLRGYTFDLYKTKPKEDEPKGDILITLLVPDPSALKKLVRAREAVAAGVCLARDLVNEPPNVLDPETFAERAEALDKLGVEVETLDEKAMKKIGMRALLAVGQGSRKDSRVVIMRWNGGVEGEAPLVVIGKGVTFDSGGISIKPGAGMEDMKGDMGGAATVVGLMHALAARKARANVVGLIGLVENMPDGGAQRPGDIVTSLSGQTIEIINTDAEGRLVLADVLAYARDRFKPSAMIDLATLTGAILVALAQEHAGLFSNDDALANKITAAGKASGETVWRLPMGAAYDKMIDSKFADMKNTGGRYAGSITAAQFLKRFVGDTPWAHLDVAGTAMASPSTDINTSWGSGWGVRLLDRMVRDELEMKPEKTVSIEGETPEDSRLP